MANIINGTDTGSGGLITTGDSSDELQLQTAETARVTLTNTAVVVNEDGNDVDFRVESDTDANAFFVEGSTGNIGVGTATPIFLSTTGSASARVLGVRNSGTDSANRGEIQIGSAATADGTFVGGILFGSGASTTTNNTTAAIYSVCEGSNTTTGQGRLEFYTTASGGTGTERMRLTSDGYLRMASGTGGIQFNGDTAAVNALDDYEEGTFTPTTSTAGYAISASAGGYTKIGRMVSVVGYVTISTVGANTSSCGFGGLPFTSATIDSGLYYAGVAREDTTSGDIFVVQQSRGGTTFSINSMDGVSSGSNQIFVAGRSYSFSVTYYV